VPRLDTLAAYGGKAAAGILGLVRSRQGRATRGRAVAWRSVLRCAGEDGEEESTAELLCVRAHLCVCVYAKVGMRMCASSVYACVA
jgi:hypothetical protein